MDIFFKASAGVLITALLALILSKQGKDFAIILCVAVCGMVLLVAVDYLSPIVSLLRNLSATANLDPSMMKVLVKAVGIGLLSEIVALICADSGNKTLGKSIQILAAVVILSLSVPLFSKFMDLISGILSTI